IRENVTFNRVVFLGGVVSFVMLFSFLRFSAQYLQFDLAGQLEAGIPEVIDRTVQMNRSFGVADEDLTSIRESLQTTLPLLIRALPAFLLSLLVSVNWINYRLALRLLKKRKEVPAESI